ncbi:MAG: nucleotide exchange factor GrpE, partial [Chloroflexota bacterium]|nr:nucleotide exchange factor GrpE [Chloroflexota bacterium]
TEDSEALEAQPEEDPTAGSETEAPLEVRLTQEQERASGYLEELQRERASFINYRRRMEQERESWGREANAALIFNLLAVLDDFERAKQAIPEDQRSASWVEGLMLVGRKLYSTLELAGVKAIEAVGKPFDPALHEAVAVQEADDVEHGTVLEEFRKGYLLGDRVLRASMVKVAQ